MLRQIKITTGALVSRAFIQVLDKTPRTGAKVEARSAIEKEVFDSEDSISDNSKAISVLLSMVGDIYDVLPKTSKDKMDAERRAGIEYVITKFRETRTTADVGIEESGTDFIDKLLNRQAKVCTIVTEAKS